MSLNSYSNIEPILPKISKYLTSIQMKNPFVSWKRAIVVNIYVDKLIFYNPYYFSFIGGCAIIIV